MMDKVKIKLLVMGNDGMNSELQISLETNKSETKTN